MELSPQEEAKIKLIHRIYDDFMAQLNDLKTEQDEVIKRVVAKIDHDKIKDTLDKLHQA
ncbi:MAG: hypothetical protein WCV88_04825 [Patescibacteria group bacterium]|jgi:hypothetical protein